MKKPQVSVVIPTFNRPLLLSDALESLTTQTDVPFEVAVINDAGTDVGNVVSQFKEKLQITYFSLPVNRGLPTARNAGLKYSSGEFVAYLDDDDLYLPGHLKALSERLEAKPHLGLVYSDALLEKDVRGKNGIPGFEQRVLAQDYDLSIMLKDSFICPSAVMHRRECVQTLGGFDEEMRWCYEDWDFLLKIGSRYGIERVEGATVKVRLRSNQSNMSSTVNPYRVAAASVLRERYGCSDIVPKTFWEVAETLQMGG
jgi:glycosyltransferase involved in cell wall biosynthesis